MIVGKIEQLTSADISLGKNVKSRPPFVPAPKKEVSDGSTANYYELPNGISTMEQLASAKNMNYSIGSIFINCFDVAQLPDNQQKLDIVNDMLCSIEQEILRLENNE